MNEPKRSSRFTPLASYTKYVAAVVLIAVVLAWQGGVFKPKMEPGQMADTRPVVEEADTVLVREVRLPVSRRFTGSLMPRVTVELSVKISGDILELNVGAGDPVEKNQVVMRVDPTLPETQRAEAEAALNMAEAERDGAESLLSHVEAAVEANALPRIKAIEARQMRDRAARGVEQRRAALDAAETRLGYTEVTSPLSGVIIDTLRDPGDFVVPGQPVMLVYNPADLEVVAYIPEDLAAFCTPGQAMEILIQPLDQKITGQVRSRVDRVDSATRTLEVKLDIAPPSGALPGMYAEVELQTREEKILVVPTEAIGRLRGMRYVRIVDSEGRINRRIVRPGCDDKGRTEILAGLEAGDRVLRDYGGGE